MSRPKRFALAPASLATDGNKGEDANARGVGLSEDSRDLSATLRRALATLGAAAAFLDAHARATDEPGPGIAEAADLIDAARAMLAQAVAP